MAWTDGLSRVARLVFLAMLVLALGSMGCVELAYRAALRGMPSLPKAPSTSLPAPLEQRLWAYFDGTPSPDMRPIYPWHILTWIARAVIGKPSSLPGFNIAGTVASMHLQALGGASTDLAGHLRGFSLIIWVSRHFSASQAVAYWAARARGPSGSTGLDAASRTLFGHSPDSITVSQLALLLAVSWNPERNDPWCHPARAAELRGRALQHFFGAGVLSDTERSAADREPLAILDGDCTRAP